ncbi:phosphatidylserine lipase ABHD16A [Leptidea sinapis]|uniref:phosphatidylserine lipase ABHD16A n=1 Tax=Leptidea sinapis TaxID=189913 RepID=UPI00213DC431|nr:phosphatidylserine lipase ABHD16A [Leptidea sinapis]XP_050683175.1 phosphatidylserine lipase ABHD16A [Leptidea sinapis]
MLKLIYQCLTSPRLYKIYGEENRDRMYQPKRLEKLGDKIISTAKTIFNITAYTSPFLCTYIYKRGFFSMEEIVFLSKVFSGIGTLIAFSFIIRAFGRAFNSQYSDFLYALNQRKTDSQLYMDGIRKFDFDFNAWPVTFAMPIRYRKSWTDSIPFHKCSNPDLPIYQRIPVQVLAYIAVNTFAMRLIYPGTLSLIHHLLWTPLLEGRTQLVETYKSQRAKILSADGNAIDTIFTNNRAHANGNILVICCEGNSGFYEIGIMTTPIKAGYSALGWNHPGFAGSTGYPFPQQEENAIEAVIQYAVNVLKFPVENIVLFGWSIGGYTASWAAVNYPDINALVLDATFDDLLPLAQNHMPKSWGVLVKEVVRTYFDLNIGELVTQYNGPIQLIRRTEDEVICLRPGQIQSNCGNDLLIRILESRYKKWFNENASLKDIITGYVAMTEAQRSTLNQEDLPEINRRALNLIVKHMRDFKSTHCTQLPDVHFASIMKTMHLKN